MTRDWVTYEQRQGRRKEIEACKKEIQCSQCGEKGHWSRECSSDKKKIDSKTKSKPDEDATIKGKTGGPQKGFIAQVVNHSHGQVLECVRENLSHGVTNAHCQALMASVPKASGAYSSADSGCTQSTIFVYNLHATCTWTTYSPLEGIGGLFLFFRSRRYFDHIKTQREAGEQRLPYSQMFYSSLALDEICFHVRKQTLTSTSKVLQYGSTILSKPWVNLESHYSNFHCCYFRLNFLIQSIILVKIYRRDHPYSRT